MRRAKAEKRSLDSVMDEWFRKNKKNHRLNQKQVDKLKKKIANFGN
jgi:predicted metalloprotease with PDZ domain